MHSSDPKQAECTSRLFTVLGGRALCPPYIKLHFRWSLMLLWKSFLFSSHRPCSQSWTDFCPHDPGSPMLLSLEIPLFTCALKRSRSEQRLISLQKAPRVNHRIPHTNFLTKFALPLAQHKPCSLPSVIRDRFPWSWCNPKSADSLFTAFPRPPAQV